MKARRFITIINGDIVDLNESSEPVELASNQVRVTENELAILRICDGDLNYAKTIIRDIEERIGKVK